MSDKKSEEKTRFGLTQAEYDNLMDLLRYGGIIVGAVAVTFVVVALTARMLGY